MYRDLQTTPASRRARPIVTAESRAVQRNAVHGIANAVLLSLPVWMALSYLIVTFR